MIILESFILSCAPTNNGQFVSCGIVQTTADELLQFFRQADGSLLLENITQDQHVVTIERASPVSGVVTERNTCECMTVGEAARFLDNVLAIAHRQDWDRDVVDHGVNQMQAWQEDDLLCVLENGTPTKTSAKHMEALSAAMDKEDCHQLDMEAEAARSDVGDEDLDDGPLTRMLYLIERGEPSQDERDSADRAAEAETHGDEDPRDLSRQHTNKQTWGN